MIYEAEFPTGTAFEINGEEKIQPGHSYSFLWSLDLNPGSMLEEKM